MNRYMTIKPESTLYKDYFEWLNDRKKVGEAFHKVKDQFGIESVEFYPARNIFCIVPTKADREKFAGVMKKTAEGAFKKNSAPHKAWVEAVKDIKWMNKPGMFHYYSGSLGHRWRERLFHDGDILYCSIESEGDMGMPDFGVEIKASEFYKVIEDIESRKDGE